MPIHDAPVSWQALQPPVTPAWIWPEVGTGVAKAEPGALRVALAGSSPAGVLPWWQFSQAVLEGMCEFGPAGVVGGITTIALMPKKLLAPMPGPWQAAQPLVMPAWLIWPLAKVVPPTLPAPAAGMGMAGIAFEWQASQLVPAGMCGGTRPALVLGVTP